MATSAASSGRTSEHLFPLRTVGDARRLFEAELRSPEPNLALLSIVAGSIEHSCTNLEAACAASASRAQETTEPRYFRCQLPIDPLEWTTVNELLERFESILRESCDSALLSAALDTDTDTDTDSRVEQTRTLIAAVSDIFWDARSSHKDRPHLQSIYSFLSGYELDSFGLALAVVAACQLLKVTDVHLALSEEHAWVVFGKDRAQTAEVTWHGNEERRGQPLDMSRAEASWMYLKGQPLVCDRHLEVAALVVAMNPSIGSEHYSLECSVLQQELLWLLYDEDHLLLYPAGLCALADLEETLESSDRPQCCLELFADAILANRYLYGNRFVFPYIYAAEYYYRRQEFKNAQRVWALAADAVKKYKYTKDDEEVYKDFLEIATKLIPSTVDWKAHGPQTVKEAATHRQVLQDPECFSSILGFYDGICSWEQDSATPVLHIGWAQHIVSTCSKFEAEVRASAEVLAEDEDAQATDASVSSSSCSRPRAAQLRSAKLKGLKKLLSAKKLNVSAIELQLTAQVRGDQERHRTRKSRTAPAEAEDR